MMSDSHSPMPDGIKFSDQPNAIAAENVVRGGLFALIALPLGVVIWVVIWSLGFVSAIVAFAVAACAALLYRKGSGGQVSKLGALVIAGVVLVTIFVSFYCGLVSSYAQYAAGELGVNPFAALLDPLFWPNFNLDFGELLSGNLLNLLFAVALGILGAFSVVRRAFTGTARVAQPRSAPVFAPAAAASAVTPSSAAVPTPAAPTTAVLRPEVPSAAPLDRTD